MPSSSSHQEQDSKKILRGGWTYGIRNPKVAILIGLIVSIWGLLSFLSVPKESAPYIPFGVVNVTTVYSGVSAEEIDSLITQKLESTIKNVSNVRRIDSVSRNSVSLLTVEFEPDHDMIKGVADIRSKVDEAKPDLPSDLESDPQILEIDSSIQPFFSIVLFGPYSAVELKDFAEDLKLFLENVSDVAGVSLSGGAEKEIIVQLDPVKLQAFSITPVEVINTIRRSNRDTPVGDFEIGTETYNIRFAGKYQTAEDIQNIALRDTAEGERVTLLRLKDIAVITEAADPDADTLRRIHFPEMTAAENAIEIQVSKGIGKNIFTVDAAVRAKALEYAALNFPPDLQMAFEKEVTAPTQESYDNVYRSGGQAIIIVMVILFIFIGFRAGIVASLVIPITFLATIGVISLRGDTLNFMSNFSMILALGILVDTAVVIVEGIHYYINQGKSPLEAAALSLHEFKGPLISGTLTTLSVFIPLFSLPGVLGKYLTFVPITVFIVLTCALFISLLLIPSYGSQIMISHEKEMAGNTKGVFGRISDRFRARYLAMEEKVLTKYSAMLRVLLRRRIWRIGTFYLVLLAFFLSFLIPIQFELFPSGDSFAFTVSVERSEGTITADTNRYSLSVEKRLLEIPEVHHISVTVSGDTSSIYAELLPIEEREEKGLRTSKEVIADLQTAIDEEFGKQSTVEISVENAEEGPPSGFPVGFRIIAADNNQIETAQQVAREMTDILREIPGTLSVKNDIEMIPGEFLYRVQREKALALGLDPEEVATTVRTALQGSTATTITRGSRDIDVTVRYAPEKRETINDIGAIQLLNRSGQYIRLEQVVDVELVSSLSSIRRRDTRIAFTVSSLVAENGNAAEITEEFLQRIADYPLPQGIEIVNAGENEENAELFAALGRAFVVAVLIMFLILVIQFNSYLQPILILTTILFAQIGVSIGLFITGTPRSLAFILGAISLAGIVVNDAIIMIDQMNKNRQDDSKGETLRESIIYAGRTRFIPVLLTTLTTSAGIIPLVFVDVFWAGLSYTIIFGLTMATLLTLFITPTMYYQMEREKVVTFAPLFIVVMIGLLFVIPGFGKIIPLVLGAFLVRSFLLKYRLLRAEDRAEVMPPSH